MKSTIKTKQTKMKTYAALALMSVCGAVTLSASQAGEAEPSEIGDAFLVAAHICVEGTGDEHPLGLAALEAVAEEEGVSVEDLCADLVGEL